MAEQHRETVEEQGVKAVLLEVGEGHVELIEPLVAGVRRSAKFIERNGEGMHHVAYQTDDIDAALEKVRAAGLRLIDEEPRIGIRGSRVAFLHPKATGGVLTELVEPAEALMAEKRATVDIGFDGGQVLALRLDKAAFDELRKAVEDDGRTLARARRRDSDVTLDLSQVVYVRLETEDHRVGF